MYELVITLKSDLCAADGDGCAAAIDTDVCIDKNGFPIIPARRLKGCLKEAAGVIGVSNEQISDIFGERGSAVGCPLHISNAVISNAEELAENAKKEAPRAVKACVLQEQSSTMTRLTAVSLNSGRV